ncbi:hypothetical protein BSLG_007425 [Batrachochytrium salamandrivorans]|nr:hypothetical protein BSLG_007425 [Batrachochytrium salamandrivorans]
MFNADRELRERFERLKASSSSDVLPSDTELVRRLSDLTGKSPDSGATNGNSTSDSVVGGRRVEYDISMDAALQADDKDMLGLLQEANTFIDINKALLTTFAGPHPLKERHHTPQDDESQSLIDQFQREVDLERRYGDPAEVKMRKLEERVKALEDFNLSFVSSVKPQEEATKTPNGDRLVTTPQNDLMLRTVPLAATLSDFAKKSYTDDSSDSDSSCSTSSDET